jgi:membrane-bound lytic murein transglycosylase D
VQIISPKSLALAETQFAVPARLRPRVEFWKYIFTKYGAGHLVFHHREFPQVIFKVVDLTPLREKYGEVQFYAVKKQVDLEHSAEIERAFKHLASGELPQTALQHQIVKVMKGVPGGSGSGSGSGIAKYQRVISEGLIRSQTGIRDKFAASIERSGKYLPMMEEIFAQYGLPRDLTRLPFIESSFDYSAYSSVGAAGIWQFMPATARSFMHVGRVVDERRDPVVATHAAAKYLRSAYQRLGSWPLAITSYNHGVAGVARKVREAGTIDISAIIEHPSERFFGFASGNFYPEFLAAVEVFRDRRKYFPEIRLNAPAQYRSHRIARAISVREAVASFAVDLDELKSLNYALTPAVWQGRYPIPKGFNLRLPPSATINVAYSKKELRDFSSDIQLSNILEEPSVRTRQDVSPRSQNSTIYTVKKGDSLSMIATRLKVSPAELMQANQIVKSKIKVGQVLRVPIKSSKKAASATNKKSTVTTSKRYYTVRPGDNLATIAKKNVIPLKKLQALNMLGSNSRLVAGQKLRLN